MRFLGRSLIGAFLFVLTLGLLMSALYTVRSAIEVRQSREKPDFSGRERIASVFAVRVNAEKLSPTLTTFGEVQSRRTLDIRSPVGGEIIAMSPDFVEGGVVQAGQVLLRIDDTDARTALTLAQADLDDANAELAESERALLIARDSLSEAQSQAQLRETALMRAKGLKTRGVGTDAAVEAAELAAASANSAVLAQRNALATAEARVARAKTALVRRSVTTQEAIRTLQDTEIKAEFSGVLSAVTTLQGGRTVPNEKLAQLIDPEALEVAFRVSSEQYTRLLDENGALLPVEIQVYSDTRSADAPIFGVILRENAVVGEGSSGRLIYAGIERAPAMIPGDFVTIAIPEPALDNVALIPSTAVGPSGTLLVLTPEDDAGYRLAEVPVNVLRRQGNDVIMRADDLDGKLIVAQRSPLIGAGIKVTAYGDDIVPKDLAEKPGQ